MHKGGCSETKKCSNSLTFPRTGLEALVIGQVHENITLHCGNVSGARGLVTWYRDDSEPVVLLSYNSSFPPAEPRFSLADASSLHITALRPRDEGNYTCREVLNETRWFRVWLQVAGKCGGRALGPAGQALGALGGRRALEAFPGFIPGSATYKPSALSHLDVLICEMGMKRILVSWDCCDDWILVYVGKVLLMAPGVLISDCFQLVSIVLAVNAILLCTRVRVYNMMESDCLSSS